MSYSNDQILGGGGKRVPNKFFNFTDYLLTKL